MDGEFLITGFRNKTLHKRIPDKNAGKVSSIIKQLRADGLLKKVFKERYTLLCNNRRRKMV